MTVGYKRVITVKLHHFIVGAPIWEGDEVDHENRNRLDNRKANISIKTRLENAQNRSDLEDAKHIRWNKGSFEVRMSRMGERIYGRFYTRKEAEEFRHGMLNQTNDRRGKAGSEYTNL